MMITSAEGVEMGRERPGLVDGRERKSNQRAKRVGCDERADNDMLATGYTACQQRVAQHVGNG